jgi:predicted dehydrogenase
LLRWLAGTPCRAVASFGSLRHFRRANAPPGAPARCLDGCPAEDTCPFHAGRFYLDRLAGWDGPPVTALTSDLSPAGRLAALRDGPYGRCVYQCDNDVPDRQVVALEFTNGVTATLTVSAFTADSTRTVRYMGSRGEIAGDLERGEIRIRPFSGHRPEPDEIVRVDVPAEAAAPTPALGAFLGHAGGDDGLMSDFVARLRRRRAGEPVAPTRTSLEQAVESHLMAFAAEESRLSGQVVTLAPAGRRDRLPV